jgi:hypothetical protein
VTVQTIASKFRRALRNGTGATFTNEQLRQLGECGVLRLLAEMEAEELCPAKIALTGETPIGSTSGETANPRSGRSLSRSEGQSYIEALAS